MAQEGEIALDFSNAASHFKLDEQGVARPEGMKLVDFVVEDEHRILLVEVKDVSDAGTTEKDRQDFARKLRANQLVNESLTPKARDSYCYLHLMAQDNKPCLLVFLLGLDALNTEPALLMGLRERLLQRIRRESDQPWVRRYVSDCVVVGLDGWNKVFPMYPASRVAAAA
jgi:hypothetical protein